MSTNGHITVKGIQFRKPTAGERMAVSMAAASGDDFRLGDVLTELVFRCSEMKREEFDALGDDIHTDACVALMDSFQKPADVEARAKN